MSRATAPTTSSAPAPAVPGAAPTQPCPICGMALAPVTLGPGTAPWLCPNLAVHRNGFWQAELDARADYLPATRSFAHHVVVGVRAAVEVERAAAAKRGTSVRPDQLRHLSQEQLSAVAGRPGVDATLRAQAASLVIGPVV